MRKTAFIVSCLLLAAGPAFAFGPGGLAHGFSAVVASSASGVKALPEQAAMETKRYCAVFGACLDGRSIAHKASWVAGRDAAMPLDRLALTSAEADIALALVRKDIQRLEMPATPASEESVDYGVLTGSVPAGQSL